MKHQSALLTKVYVDNRKKLERYATSRTNNVALGEDLVQRTFLKTWSYLLKGGKIEVMDAFLYHVLKALIIDEYRKNKNSSLDIMMEKGFDIATDDTQRGADIIDGTQLMALIDTLPVAYQEVMHLRYKEDRSLEEISVITGKTKNAVTVKTHRGLLKLKALVLEQTECL